MSYVFITIYIVSRTFRRAAQGNMASIFAAKVVLNNSGMSSV